MKKISIKRTLPRALALILIAVLLLPSLISCHAGVEKNTLEVGTVGKYSVPYEEFYFLAHNHYNAIKDSYKNDPEGLEKAVWDYVKENIVANYAILSLCEDEGIIYDEDELDGEVDEYIENVIIVDYGEDEDDYYESLFEMGVTDHYARFVTGVDLLYQQLVTKYKENGTVPNTDEKLTDYIKKNFIHTCHLTIFVNPGENKDTKRAKAEEALAKLTNGEYRSVVNMLGSKYNEVLAIPSTEYDGEYFPKGVMDKAFEDAAFSLDVGDHSGVVEGISKNMNGQYVECFYVIERMKSLDAEIESNFEELSAEVTNSILYEKIEAKKAKLSYTPNEYAKELDVHALVLDEGSIIPDTVMLLIVGVVACAIMVGIVIVVRTVRKKRFRASLVSTSKNK
jgi:hypothetical protein